MKICLSRSQFLLQNNKYYINKCYGLQNSILECGLRWLAQGHKLGHYSFHSHLILSAHLSSPGNRVQYSTVWYPFPSQAPVKARGSKGLALLLACFLHSSPPTLGLPSPCLLTLWLPVDRLPGQAVPEHGPCMSILLPLFTAWESP